MYATVTHVAGHPPLGNLGLVVDASANMPHGTILHAQDPWWGAGEFMYARANGSIRQFGLCVLTPVFDSTTSKWFYNMTEVPNTANLGRPLAVAIKALSSGQFGFFCISGVTPVNCSVSVAADTAFGITAAGQAGAVAAGKQILNGRVVAPGSTTVAKANCTNAAGSTILNVPNTDGWFPGVYLSGTGVASGATVSSVEPGGRKVTMSAVSTAAIAGTVTATYNNATIYYNVAHISRPHAQGAIT
jgi:hypothetical protein